MRNILRPEGPEWNSPGRQAGVSAMDEMSAEGATLNQKCIAYHIRLHGDQVIPRNGMRSNSFQGGE